MQSVVSEVAPDVYRISTFHADFGLQFNQFLIKDDEPFLMHTGLRRMFPVTHEAVARVIDPATLRWIGFSHFEPDECGALNDWLRVAPHAQPVANMVGSLVMLGDYADRPARMLADGEVLETGRRRIRLVSTPHLPHGWDAALYFEETQRTLLCSDLFFQGGNPPALTESDIVGAARAEIEKNLVGPLAHDLPYTPYTDALLRKLAALEPRTLAVMHGSSFHGDGGQAILKLAEALRGLLGEARPG